MRPIIGWTRTATLALILAAVSAPALAQNRGGSQAADTEPMQQIEREKRDRQAEVDRQYRSTLQRTSPGQAPTGKIDPWSNMRGDVDSKKR